MTLVDPPVNRSDLPVDRAGLRGPDPGSVSAVRERERGVEVDLGGPRLSLAVLARDVVRIRFSIEGDWPRRRSWAVTPPDDSWPPLDVAVDRQGDRITVGAAAGLIARLGPAGELEIADPTGEVLVRDGPARGVAWDTDGGRVTWDLEMPDDRRYVGFGERTGPLEKRGLRYSAWTTDEWRHQGSGTDALYVAIPFFLALDPDGRAHGIYLDSTRRSAFDLTALDAGRLTMEVAAPDLTWYVIHGPEPAAVVERFTALVGRHQLPPRWALGYHQARWSYGTEAEVRDVARGLRQHGIPADAINLDIDHMDRFRVFTWDHARFPDPAGLTDDLRRLGLRTTVVVDANVNQDDDFPTYREGRTRGAFVRLPDGEELTGYLWDGVSAYPDHARASVRRWWGGLHGAYLDAGVAGFFEDMNEPAMHDRPIDEPGSVNAEPPPETPFGEGPDAATHAEVRNVYGQLAAEGVRAALLDLDPAARPFVVSRAGYAGIQRHAMSWTGDNWSSWEHLQTSLPQLLNLGLSGVSLAGADIGGFFGSCSSELLVRWTQLGAFYPYARNNSARGTARQEPWSRGEPTTARCRRAVELRYRLLPLLYTLVREACRTGAPVLRPLLYDFPGDRRAHGVEDQAMVGPGLLLAPVLRPGVTDREVYLPPGRWWDLRAARWLDGGRAVLASAGLDEDPPLFARAGTILVTGPVMAWTDERPLDPLTVEVFANEEGAGTGLLYEDDGASMAYLDGAFATTRLEAHGPVVTGQRAGAYASPPRRVEVAVHDRSGTRRASVDDDGRSGWRVDVR